MEITLDLKGCKNSNDIIEVFSSGLYLSPPVNFKWDALADSLFCVNINSDLVKKNKPKELILIIKNLSSIKNNLPREVYKLENLLKSLSMQKTNFSSNEIVLSLQINSEKIIERPFLNLDEDLPLSGSVFDAAEATGSNFITPKFIKTDEHVYYSENNFGDIDDGKSGILKIK